MAPPLKGLDYAAGCIKKGQIKFLSVNGYLNTTLREKKYWNPSPGVHEKSINPPNDPCSQCFEFSLKPQSSIHIQMMKKLLSPFDI